MFNNRNVGNEHMFHINSERKEKVEWRNGGREIGRERIKL